MVDSNREHREDDHEGPREEGEGEGEGEESVEELYDEMTEGRDDATSRESFERALIEQGRSEEGQDVGDHIE